MLIASLLLLLPCAQLEGSAAPGARELFEDPRFLRGLSLTADRHPAPKVELGTLVCGTEQAGEEPAWRIAQWGSRHLLLPGRCTPLKEGLWEAETPGKRFQIERPDGGPVRLLLEVRGATEYDGRMRASGEAWPHMLIEQRFDAPIELQRFARLNFGLEMRVDHCRAAEWAEGKLDPGLHAAQVSAFFTVHNLNPDSPDHQEMIWFGIPLFDVRHAVPPGHYALDVGKDDASGKFICSLDGKRFWQGNTGDGAWRKLDADLVPLLRDALEITKRHGYMTQTRFEDLALTTFNLGWEVPGPYDAAIELRGLTLKGSASAE